MLVDTHCHIHEPAYLLDVAEVLRRARLAGVDKMICVGTSVESSKQAVAFATRHDDVFASIGVHPHDTKDGWEGVAALAASASSRPATLLANTLEPESDQTPRLLSDPERSSVSQEGSRKGDHNNQQKLVAIGEIGLDYFYTHSPRDIQIRALEGQIDLSIKHNLPVIFHVRDAFDDFWPIFDNFHGLRGVLHSFTDTTLHMEQALQRGLYIGVNGISTFTRDEKQKEMFAAIPVDKLLLETDAPFLTPIPFRGKVNEPAFVEKIGAYQAYIRGISSQKIAVATTANANALFALH